MRKYQNLFICNTSHTLSLMESYVSKHNLTNCLLITNSNRRLLKGLVANELWEDIIHLDNSVGFFKNSIEFKAVIQSNQCENLHIGHLENNLERVAVSILGKEKSFLLFDEGITTIEYAYNGFSFLRSNKLFFKLKYRLVNIYLSLLFFKKIISFEELIINIRSLVTSFEDIYFEGVAVEHVDIFPYPIEDKPVRKCVFFVGQLLPWKKKYYKNVATLASLFENAGFDFYYFPHPRENDHTGMLDKSYIKVIDKQFELYLFDLDYFPYSVLSYSSTVLVNCCNKFKKVRFVAILDKHDSNNYIEEVLYKSFFSKRLIELIPIDNKDKLYSFAHNKQGAL